MGLIPIFLARVSTHSKQPQISLFSLQDVPLKKGDNVIFVPNLNGGDGAFFLEENFNCFCCGQKLLEYNYYEYENEVYCGRCHAEKVRASSPAHALHSLINAHIRPSFPGQTHGRMQLRIRSPLSSLTHSNSPTHGHLCTSVTVHATMRWM